MILYHVGFVQRNCFIFCILIHRAKTAENNNNCIQYEDFINTINWRDFPVPPVQYNASANEEWTGTKKSNQINAVNYFPLLEKMFGPLEENTDGAQ